MRLPRQATAPRLLSGHGRAREPNASRGIFARTLRSSSRSIFVVRAPHFAPGRVRARLRVCAATTPAYFHGLLVTATLLLTYLRVRERGCRGFVGRCDSKSRSTSLASLPPRLVLPLYRSPNSSTTCTSPSGQYSNRSKQFDSQLFQIDRHSHSTLSSTSQMDSEHTRGTLDLYGKYSAHLECFKRGGRDSLTRLFQLVPLHSFPFVSCSL